MARPGLWQWFQSSRQLIAGVLRDLAAWPVRGPRLIDELECVVSVLLAILLAHLLDAKNVGWAAFSGYMVMRSHVRESFRRGLLRIVGTAAGAGAALLGARLLESTLLLSVALGCVGAASLYMALISRRSYAWLFIGLTFMMALLDTLEHPADSLASFAWSRCLEIVVGTVACVLVSAVSTVTVRRALGGGQAPAAGPEDGLATRWWHREAMVHAVQGGLALALLPAAWKYLHIGGLSQAGVTVMAVMMVPLASLASRTNQTTTRLAHRFAGCALGGLLASGILLASHQLPVVMTLGICIGVIVGRHIENGDLGIGYLGTQFALAFLVILVPDHYANPDLHAGLTRIMGVLFGMLLLEPVRWLFRACSRQSLRSPTSG